jgi:hypothetical protein
MEKRRDMNTLTEQFLLDSELTEYRGKSRYDGSALQNKVQSEIHRMNVNQEEQPDQTLLDVPDDEFVTQEWDKKDDNELLFDPLSRPKELTYTVTLQHWLGHVKSISEDTFTASLKDLTNGGTDEVATVDMIDVPADDKALLTRGAAFYWTLSYRYEKGQIRKESTIRFQRIVHLSNDELDSVLDSGKSFFSGLNFQAED